MISDVPRYRGYNRECLSRAVRLPWPVDCEASEASMTGALSSFEESLRATAAADPKHIQFLNSKSLLCPNGRCSGSHNGVSLYFDEGHLSLEGGRTLARDAALVEDGSWLRALRYDAVKYQ